MRQPNVPTGGSQESLGPDNLTQTEIWGYTAPNIGAGTVSKFTIWLYFDTYDANQTIVPSIWVNGGWVVGAQWDLVIGDQDSWVSREFSGSWDQADVTALQTRFTNASDDSSNFSACYVEITYS